MNGEWEATKRGNNELTVLRKLLLLPPFKVKMLIRPGQTETDIVIAVANRIMVPECRTYK